MKTANYLRTSYLLLLTLAISNLGFAQWNDNPAINNAIAAGNNKSRFTPWIEEDGNGGHFVAWAEVDFSGVYGAEIYAQHIDAGGNRLWPSTGVLVCNAQNYQTAPRILKDGIGGAFITWGDQRNNFRLDVYAQHIAGDGTLLWANNGILLINSSNEELGPEMISDGKGGAIVVCWSTRDRGNTSDIVAQRVDGQGALLWGEQGAVICQAPGRQVIPRIVTDGQGGGVIVWEDFRAGIRSDIYAQHINANGQSLWTPDGKAVCTAPNDQVYLQVTVDGNGGAIATWSDFRTSTQQTNHLDIYAQRISAAGEMMWTTDGAAVCTQQDEQGIPYLVTDGKGGAIISWSEIRGGQYSIYAQRMLATGSAMWKTDGIAVCTRLRGNLSVGPFMTSDEKSGAIVVWKDDRFDENATDIYAQHISLYGGIEWTDDGVPVSDATGYQYIYQDGQGLDGCVIPDGNGSAITVWSDGRNKKSDDEFNSDIYAAKAAGIPPVPRLLLVTDQCAGAITAKGKLANPPVYSSISLLQDGVAMAYSSADSSFVYFTTQASQPGRHTISVSYTNEKGTTTKDSFYTVSASTSPTVSIQTNHQSTCTGATVSFTAKASDAGQSPLFTWALNGVETGNATSTYTSSGLQNGDVIQCTLIITDASLHCTTATEAASNSIKMTVSETTVPSILLSASANDVCPSTPVLFTAAVSNNSNDETLTYQWKINGATSGTGPSYTTDHLRDQDAVSCVLTVAGGTCASATVASDTILMNVKAVPAIVLQPADTIVTFGSVVQLQATVTGDISDFTWTPQTGLSDAHTLHPATIPVTETADYVFTATTPEGCIVSKHVSLTLFSGVSLPTAFTPNGDGLNDFFRMPPHTLTALTRFSVFSRYGGELFRTMDVSAGWNGRDKKGNLQPPGAYVYTFEGVTIENKKIYIKGMVTLVR